MPGMFIATLFLGPDALPYLEITGRTPRCWRLPTRLDTIPELVVLAEHLMVDGEVPHELTLVDGPPDGSVKYATYRDGVRTIRPPAPSAAVGMPRFLRYTETVTHAATSIEDQLTLRDIADQFGVGYSAARLWMAHTSAPDPISPPNTKPIRWHRAHVEAYLLDPANPNTPDSPALWRARALAAAKEHLS